MEIRRLVRGDGERLREVRLRALAEAPYAFSSSLQRESRHQARFWQDRVAESERGHKGAVFVAVEQARSRGMAGGYFPDASRDRAEVWGVWVEPAARRRGIARLLLDAVAQWAREQGARSLRLEVTDCAAAKPATALYRGLGFRESGETQPLESDESLITRVMSSRL